MRAGEATIMKEVYLMGSVAVCLNTDLLEFYDSGLFECQSVTNEFFSKE